MHGLFDEEGIALTIVNSLLREKGIDKNASAVRSEREIREKGYKNLAEKMRENLDIDRILRIMY